MTTNVAGGDSEATEVLKDLLIVQLGLADIPQRTNREIVGRDMHRVTRIVRHLKRKTKED